ncbi:hypothetical protein T492DRAFT_487679 [Pavlovales sp. CCMP2436]|nr:hypothetical protein T492DRAFT_487679 [Pavlovales sp. CCMP2436]
MEEVARAARAWGGLGLSARRAELDQQSLALVDEQERSAEGREALRGAVRDFKAIPAADRPAKVGGVVKAFQAEVDALSRRAAFAEAAFFSVYHLLEAAPDPTAPLLLCQDAVSRLAKAEADAVDATAELAEYRKEALLLKNQDHTVKRLQAQLREAEEARNLLVTAELAKRTAGADAARAAAEAAMAEREAEAAARAAKDHAELRALAAERDEAHEYGALPIDPPPLPTRPPADRLPSAPCAAGACSACARSRTERRTRAASSWSFCWPSSSVRAPTPSVAGSKARSPPRWAAT